MLPKCESDVLPGIADVRRILIVGSDGAVGNCLAAHWKKLGHHLIQVDRRNGFAAADLRGADLAGVGAVVWVATNPPPHIELAPRVAETLDWLAVLAACREAEVPRVIFTSSFGIGINPGMRPDACNFYAAGKIAGEAFAEAHARSSGCRVVTIRLGAFGPLSEDEGNRPFRLSPSDIALAYDAALTSGEQYACIVALPKSFIGAGEERADKAGSS